MHYQDAQIGQQVVRSKGDYVVGRLGEIIDKDEEKNRARVSWTGEGKTWVSMDSIEPTFIPYEIMPAKYDKQGVRISWPKYKKK